MARGEGFERFVVAAGPGLLKTARLLTGDWHLGQDLLQATLAKVYTGWRRVDEADSPVAYARRIMVNTHCTWYRRLWRREMPFDVMPETAGGDAAEAVARADVLRQALRRLTVRQRAIVVLRYYDDLSVQETASVMRCSAGTVLSVSSRALARLRLNPELRAELDSGQAVEKR